MIPTVYTQIVYWCWPALAIVWLVGKFRNKRTLRRFEIGRYLGTNLLIALGFFLLFIADRRIFGPPLTPQNGAFGVIGDILCIGGVLFAIWARIIIGRNWSGSVATLKEDHELAQKGPYRLVRHPIYTGFFFAMLGTALTLGTLAGYLGVILGLAAFLIRIPIEERLMLEKFPDTYATYKKTVKALIPFVW